MEELVESVYKCIQRRRLNLNSEAALQLDIENAFKEDGIVFEREVILSKKDRPDFMCGCIAVEVKIKGSAKSIYRQCERYCQHGLVEALILVTNRSMGLPEEINGKPCYLINLGRGWL